MIMNSLSSSNITGGLETCIPQDRQGTKLCTWSTLNGEISLYRTSSGRFQALVIQKEKITTISEAWIQGLPKELRTQPQSISQFFEETYVKLGIQNGGTFSLYINHRIKGGMLGVMGGGLSVLSSAIGFCTANNYRKMVSQATAAIKVAGVESRATIVQAETSAHNVLGKMGREVRQSVEDARTQGQVLIRTAGDEVGHLLTEGGIEARHTAKILELQVEKALSHASKEAELIFTKMGQESRKTIQLSGQEARDLCLTISKETRENVTHTREETSRLLGEGSREVKEILKRASAEARDLIVLAGEACETRSLAVIQKGLEAAQRVIQRTIDDVNRVSEQVIARIGQEAKGLILDLGDQGRILIKDTGQEIRVTADAILTEAFRGLEMTINTAGDQFRLTIQEAGKEFRSILYELPSIAGQTAFAAGNGLVVGMLDGLIGVTEANRILYHLKEDLFRQQDLQLENVIGYVGDQGQLSPIDKASLYLFLIQTFNRIVFAEELRLQWHLFIGVAALTDPQFEGESFRPSYLSLSSINLRDHILKKFPNNARSILETEGVNALDRYRPRIVDVDPIPLIEEINPLEEIVAQQSLRLIEAERNAEDFRLANQIAEEENRLLREEREQQRLALELLQQNLEPELAHSQARVVELERTVTSLQADAVYYKALNR